MRGGRDHPARQNTQVGRAGTGADRGGRGRDLRDHGSRSHRVRPGADPGAAGDDADRPARAHRRPRGPAPRRRGHHARSSTRRRTWISGKPPWGAASGRCPPWSTSTSGWDVPARPHPRTRWRSPSGWTARHGSPTRACRPARAECSTSSPTTNAPPPTAVSSTGLRKRSPHSPGTACPLPPSAVVAREPSPSTSSASSTPRARPGRTA